MSEATLYVPVPPRSRGCERGCEAGALIARSQRPRRRPVQELEIRNWGMRFRASGFRGQGFAFCISHFAFREPGSGFKEERCSPRQKSRLVTSESKNGTSVNLRQQWISQIGFRIL